MEKKLSDKISLLITALGLLVLFTAFFQWTMTKKGIEWWSWMAALISVVLASAIYIKFVPKWIEFWQKSEDTDCKAVVKAPQYTYIKIFLGCTAYCILVLVLIFLFRYINGYSHTFAHSMQVWRETDANHFQDIAREWYLSEGEWDRLVQLVFLPGYPIAIKLMGFLIKDYYLAGFAVSIISFGAAGCVFYKLLRLDCGHKTAVRTLKYLCVFPATLFFAGPMSESLFLLLYLSSLYCIRTKRWLLGGVLGGYATFTRSLGITLVVPVILECVRDAVNSGQEKIVNADTVKKVCSALIVPLGFLAYCCINYTVSGDFFKFMEYQRVHWSQNLGWFFNTASYQTELVVSNWGQNFKIIAGLWLPSVIMYFAALLIILFASNKLRPSYTAWFIAYFVTATGVTWLISGPRYYSALMVLPIALGQITKNKTADFVLTACCIILNIAYLYVFSVRWYVW